MAHTFTREELYALVWSEPMRTVAQKFDISDVGLAKACRHANIPVPPRGYWAKKDAKKPVHRIPLPPRDPGDDDEVKIGQDQNHYYRYRYDENSPLPREPVFEEPMESVRARVEKAVGKVRVASTLDLAHPAVRAMVQKDERRRQKYVETNWSFYAPIFDKPLHARRLRILNALFLALAAQRCSGSLRGETADEIFVHVGRTGLSLSLAPVSGKKAFDASSATSRKESLRLAAVSHRDGSVTTLAEDEPGNTIEQRLRNIVVDLLVLGETRYRENCRHHYEWQLEVRERDIEEARKEREEAARRERDRIAALEKARVDNLLDEAVALQKAMNIRKYVADVQNASAAASISQDDFELWAKWALEQADRIDPVVSGRFLESFMQLRDDMSVQL